MTLRKVSRTILAIIAATFAGVHVCGAEVERIVDGTDMLAGTSVRRLAIDPQNSTTLTLYLPVSNAPANTSIQLLGVSNGVPWKVSDWRTTDSNGGWGEGGIFPKGVEGEHSLRVDVGGSLSNTISFVVSNCKL